MLEQVVDDIVVVSEEWPSNGIGFNRWWLGHKLFIDVLARSEFHWTEATQFKYLGYQVDTRTDTFVIRDRDGNPTDPMTVLNTGRES
jgi:hypothetical protein